MKKKYGILFILFSIIIVYVFFIHKQSEFIAGEYRYYTLYDEFKSKDKKIDFSAASYENDKYKLEEIKRNIIQSTEKIENYRQQLISFRESIYHNENSLSDYDRYIENLELLKSEIESEKKYLNYQRQDLTELNNFIAKIERGLLSIKMYNSDISNIHSVLNSIDSLSNDFSYSVDVVKLQATSRALNLAEEIERKKKEKEERERQEYIAKLQIEREIELQKQNYSYYSPKKVKTEYNNYDYYRESYIPTTSSYYSSPKVSTYSVPNNSSYPSTYLPPTNPNAAPAVVEVKGYYKSNGTYVAPHVRTAPNSTKTDNLRFP